MGSKPYVWQMIKEAVENSPNEKVTYAEIKNYIKNKYGNVNENTINAQIIVCTVNQSSRVHYPENQKPRIANSKYDFLFTIGRGQVVLYDPNEHGVWEIRKNEYGKLIVAQKGLEEDVAIVETENGIESTEPDLLFPVESHLRDFIAQNIQSLDVNGKKLKLYTDDEGRNGVEYPTDVGLIDILAVDEEGNFVVFELKLSKGPDAAIGQIARYMGWVKKNIAKEKLVSGVIVAKKVDDKLKYAASIVPEISLFEYQLNFTIEKANI
ncbi:endonuclease NucS domain-containing protein [Thermaerobacillus caldiproteolyticus]|uniref:endonuclease NucS domain-containing protein n=1 Tax=Thermaerobacillus caldiproteolyticus TaxID=247480 RepID=UPI0018F24E47|nr:endonuclease NucS domain-containing protein [Anoxybacillus caldiproteolyticus]